MIVDTDVDVLVELVVLFVPVEILVEVPVTVGEEVVTDEKDCDDELEVVEL